MSLRGLAELARVFQLLGHGLAAQVEQVLLLSRPARASGASIVLFANLFESFIVLLIAVRLVSTQSRLHAQATACLRADEPAPDRHLVGDAGQGTSWRSARRRR